MPMDRSRYPTNWKEISERIRFQRAQNRCEQCGVHNHTWIVRSMEDGSQFVYLDEETLGFKNTEGQRLHPDQIPESILANPKTTWVILTVHHIGVDKPDGTLGDPCDKMDCRDENLIALCQRCHLLADMPINIPARKHTRHVHKHQRIQAAGQQEMF